MEMKPCKECGVTKAVSKDYFYRHAAFADGWDNRCKECRKKLKANKGGAQLMTNEERIAKIKERQAALKGGTASVPATATSPVAPTPAAPAPAPKPRKKRKARKLPALPTLSSDRIVSEMIDVANIVKNGKVLLRQKCEELLAALDKEANG